jgi:hypothetical protein
VSGLCALGGALGGLVGFGLDCVLQGLGSGGSFVQRIVGV